MYSKVLTKMKIEKTLINNAIVSTNTSMEY